MDGVFQRLSKKRKGIKWLALTKGLSKLMSCFSKAEFCKTLSSASERVLDFLAKRTPSLVSVARRFQD